MFLCIEKEVVGRCMKIFKKRPHTKKLETAKPRKHKYFGICARCNLLKQTFTVDSHWDYLTSWP